MNADLPIAWTVINEKPSSELFPKNSWHSASYWLPSYSEVALIQTLFHCRRTTPVKIKM